MHVLPGPPFFKDSLGPQRFAEEVDTAATHEHALLLETRSPCIVTIRCRLPWVKSSRYTG
jgi:hypothetical protein